ncbi:hypothetical protein Lfu02_48080 [Longispora fulva]|uniref:Uncharacterized protein n=1 Tax=Longispora fulva TaxID=619741 RepID=A0A8J7KKI9_9ACTN|nr:hypothetical protein [Longispora fulva]MBG6138184.1 hypothetical protein [Longispora fulva]GIG60436.1 hypothetical protein Lfu02_48080 [Longispora fulva]
MGEQELTFTNPQIAPLVSSSRQIGPDTWEITLVDGSVITTRVQGNRIDGDFDAWWLAAPGASVHISADDNGMRTAHVPDGLTFSEGQGLKTSYDLASLGDAQRWLQDMGDVARKLQTGMADIRKLIDGPTTTGTSLGGFPKAAELKGRHDGLYTGFEGMLATVAEDLYDAYDALGEVMSNYVSVEDRNRMTAEQMQKILAEQATTQHPMEGR